MLPQNTINEYRNKPLIQLNDARAIVIASQQDSMTALERTR